MVEVTQEDREAVRAFHAKALGLVASLKAGAGVDYPAIEVSRIA